MRRRAFIQNKLWRDHAVDMLEKQGSIIHWQRLDDEMFDKELRLKLIEEAKEVASATSEEELYCELADVLEIIDTICISRNLSQDKIRALQIDKKATRGGFEERKYVTLAEHLEGSFGACYCLADSEKYPELKPQD